MISTYLQGLKGHKKAFAWLIDPDKCEAGRLKSQLAVANDTGVDLIFVGGSLTFRSVDPVIEQIKEYSSIPVVLFPGSPLQLSDQADAVLLLSLISGRNPDYLIGSHVIAAPFLKESGLEIIPTGYLLIHGGRQTSVSYMSNTQPIPDDKPDIALATALAGEMLGFKIIFMDAGSGAIHPVPRDMIASVSSVIGLPLIIGGGLKTPEDVRNAYDAGADIVVVGNAVEDYKDRLGQLINERNRFNT